MPTIPILVSAKPGSRQPGIMLNALGNRARVVLQSALSLPSSAHNFSIGLRHVAFYFTFPNIMAGDTVRLEYSHDGVAFTDLVSFALPRGMYDIEALDGSVQTALGNRLAAINAALGTSFGTGGDILSVKPNWAIERVMLQHGFVDWLTGSRLIRITFGQSIGTVLGFPDPVVLDAASMSHIDAPDRASFNSVNNIIITSDLVTNGGLDTSLVNSSASGGFVGQVLIDAEPSKQVIYNQVLDTRIPIELPPRLTAFEVALLDDHGRDLLMTNDWSVMLALSYDV